MPEGEPDVGALPAEVAATTDAVAAAVGGVIPASCPARAAGAHGGVKMGDAWGVVRDAGFVLVLVSPRLVWCAGLPGSPGCCEHACQIRQFSEAPGRRFWR